jgi:hypothetical protein
MFFFYVFQKAFACTAHPLPSLLGVRQARLIQPYASQAHPLPSLLGVRQADQAPDPVQGQACDQFGEFIDIHAAAAGPADPGGKSRQDP